jgi:hypothetical protein
VGRVSAGTEVLRLQGMIRSVNYPMLNHHHPQWLQHDNSISKPEWYRWNTPQHRSALQDAYTMHGPLLPASKLTAVLKRNRGNGGKAPRNLNSAKMRWVLGFMIPHSWSTSFESQADYRYGRQQDVFQGGTAGCKTGDRHFACKLTLNQFTA